MARERVPGYITKQTSNDFGLTPFVRPKLPNGMYPSGDPHNLGMSEEPTAGSKLNYRRVIPDGVIGSSETEDFAARGLPTYVDTVQPYEGEARDPKLHGAVEALRSADSNIEFNSYRSFQPRCAPMPRNASDEGFLEPPANLSADPLMTDADSTTLFAPRSARQKNMFGENRDGVLHNDGHPGFSAAQSQIQGEGYSAKAAGAILASKSRGASPAAKKANPRLNRVK